MAENSDCKENVNSLETIDPLIESLMKDCKDYWLTVDRSKDNPNIVGCLVREPSGIVKVDAYGETIARAVNLALSYYKKGFTDDAIWLKEPKHYDPNVGYSHMDRAVLKNGVWLIAGHAGEFSQHPVLDEVKKEDILLFATFWDTSVEPKEGLELSRKTGNNFLELYKSVEQDVKEYFGY